jgi:hypothetical protein
MKKISRIVTYIALGGRPAFGLRVEQPVQMHDEIAHMGVVHAPVGCVAPGGVRLGVIRVDADDIERLQVEELDSVEGGELTAEDEMEELPRATLSPALPP